MQPNNKNHCVVVVKVEEGEDPPYVWQHDKKEEIYIRDNDTCILATLSKIETLFKKRAKLQEEKSKRGHFINPSVFIPEEGDSVNNYNQSFHCMPFGDVTLIMDKKDEDEMRQLVISNLKMLNYETDNKSVKPFIPNSSVSSSCDFSDGSIRINIGFSKNGEIGMATSLYSTALKKCDWSVIIRYARNFLTIAEAFYKKYNYYGKIDLTYKIFTKELSIVDEEMIQRDLKRDYFGQLNGLSPLYNKTMYTEELSNHNELITQLLNKIIRELGYSYDYEKLLRVLNSKNF